MISAWFRGVLGYPVRKMLLKTRFSVSARRKFPWRRSSRNGRISCMAARHLGMSEDRVVGNEEETEARRWDDQTETRQRMLGGRGVIPPVGSTNGRRPGVLSDSVAADVGKE